MANIVDFHSHWVKGGVGCVSSGEGVVHSLDVVRAYFTDFGLTDGGVAKLVPSGVGVSDEKSL